MRLGERRPELDGIRGLAVLGVVLVHGGIAPGGHLGVVVFFVLSGYLITSLLMAERDRTGSVNLRDFYRRRAVRLLPAYLIAVEAAVLLTGPSRHTVTVALLGYGMNLLVPAWGWAPVAFLGFTWTLALEEQFYLLWPPVLRRVRNVRRVAGWLLVLALAIAVVRADTARSHFLASYFLFRADGLLVGCALAMCAPRVKAWAGWVSLAVLAGLYATATFTAPWSLRYAVTVATVASALVIGASDTPALRAVLSWRPLRHLGDISYSLYLWNSMLDWLIWNRTHFDMTRPVVVACWLALSLTLAEASTWLVERPFRRHANARHEAASRGPRLHLRGTPQAVPAAD